MTGPFFENHVLGIMALLADTINDGKGPQPIAEKVRCVGAVREMIKLAKSHVSNGLPQVSPKSVRRKIHIVTSPSFTDLCMLTISYEQS